MGGKPQKENYFCKEKFYAAIGRDGKLHSLHRKKSPVVSDAKTVRHAFGDKVQVKKVVLVEYNG